MLAVLKSFIESRLAEIQKDSQLLTHFSRLLGVGLPLVFCVLLPLIFGIPHQWWSCWVGAIILVLGKLWPGSLTYIYVGWMGLGEVMQRVNAVIIFGLMFFLIITPIGFIFRIFGIDSLKEKWDSRVDSYRTDFSNDNPLERIKNTF